MFSCIELDGICLHMVLEENKVPSLQVLLSEIQMSV